ncbi:class II histone deacetylase [Halegenticoccus tardaugens]|uniref:class II histone deacetylase n=1 Tax=Halegenticoccus tardaugens TaxID=2071624 RepID=UPI00100BFBEE|nr:class II histone deacetylase [Halegenticoccus tardaugens]
MAADRALDVYWHEETLRHEAPAGAFKLASTPIAGDEPHPDRPERIENIVRTVEHAFDDRSRFVPVEPAPRDRIERVHDPSYVSWLEEFCAKGGGRIEDTTTGANRATFEAARYAAGTALAAARAALDVDGADGEEAIPYALARPSGHHAQSDRADGFCFFNNVAIAAAAALEEGAVDRVAIVDWDVHHCNGTQEIFDDRDDALVVSLHHDHGSWHPTYHPQEGSLDEVGSGAGAGYTVNVPLAIGTGDRGYEYAFERLVEPIVRAYDPDLLLVSAGQDAGVVDPNGRNLVTRPGFRRLGERTRALADDAADGRFALVQEGGYQPSHLSFATLGVLEGVLGTTVDLDRYGTGDPFDWLDEPVEHAKTWIDAAAEAHAERWPVE